MPRWDSDPVEKAFEFIIGTLGLLLVVGEVTIGMGIGYIASLWIPTPSIRILEVVPWNIVRVVAPAPCSRSGVQCGSPA